MDTESYEAGYRDGLAARKTAEAEAFAAHYRRMFGLQQQARDLGRNISTGGQGWRGSTYGMVPATCPEGVRAEQHDSWRCHHEHPDDLTALGCALSEVRRLAGGGAYEPCTAGPDCQADVLCRQEWARLKRGAGLPGRS